MSNLLAGAIIATLFCLLIVWLRSEAKLARLTRAAQRLVRASRPSPRYDEELVPGDRVREVRFLVGDKVSVRGDE